MPGSRSLRGRPGINAIDIAFGFAVADPERRTFGEPNASTTFGRAERIRARRFRPDPARHVRTRRHGRSSRSLEARRGQYSKKLEPLLQEGDRLLVLDGPVQASGYDWYQVKPLTRLGSPTQLAPLGWVAVAGKNGEPWINQEDTACPPDPGDLYDVVSLGVDEEIYVEIACFSGQEITFPARPVTPSEWCGLGEWPAIEPEWMGECTTAPNYLVPIDDAGEALHPVWSPDVDLSVAPEVESPPEDWPTVEITGIFDHPESRTCRLSDESTYSPAPDPAEIILGCRMQFVVTSLREVDG